MRIFTIGMGVFMVALMTSWPTSMSAGLLDEFKIPFTAACAGITSMVTIDSCSKDFESNMRQYEILNPNGNGNMEVPDFVLCCAVSKLQTCITKEIGSTCGSDAESTAKVIMKGFFKGFKLLNNQLNQDGQIQCDWDEFYFHKESPLCWPMPAQVVGAIVLFILFITCCCCCCCRLCCRRRKPQVPIFIPFVANTSANNDLTPSRTGRSNIAYQNLQKTEV